MVNGPKAANLSFSSTTISPGSLCASWPLSCAITIEWKALETPHTAPLTRGGSARTQGRRFLRHRLGYAGLKNLPVEMANGRRQRIGSVSGHPAGYSQKRANHHLHLLFSRVAKTNDGGFDLHRRVFMHFNAILSRR